MFFCVNAKEEIGKYLDQLINKKFKSRREFCRKIIELGYGTDLDNLCTKYSDIANGKNNLQLEDLPVVTEILGITCEELLSCGEYKAPQSIRLTNHDVVASSSDKIWENYLGSEDKVFLNSDEYGKTVIDYALEFRNYNFIKYLFEKGYIFLADKEERFKYSFSFGAGTSIKPRDMRTIDSAVPIQLQEEDRIRTQSAMLAIENNDIEVLDILLAKEIPALYHLNSNYYIPDPEGVMSIDKYRNGDLIKAITFADEKIIAYFSEPIIIKEMAYGNENKYLFPFIDEVIDRMIKAGEARKVELLLRRVLKHNKYVLKNLEELTNEAFVCYKESSPLLSEEYEATLLKNIRKNIWLEKGLGHSLVGFCIRNSEHNGIVSNFFRISALPKDALLQELVEEINTSYDKIIELIGE